MISRSFLKKVSIFGDCTEHELASIAAGLTEFKAAAGEIIFREGDEGSELYIVKRGLVTIGLRTTDGNEKELARCQAGNFFGEMSIVDDAPRSATCRALEDSVLYRMHERDYNRVLEAQPRAAIKIMYKMLNTIAHRLETTSHVVADMVRWGNEASRRAITDEVTGAYNRRYLDSLLADRYSGGGVSGKPFSLVMMDVDRFREINEARGHEVGNKLLARLVETIKLVLKQTDVIARYGGDEFTLLLPDAGLQEASARAEEIRRAVEGMTIRIPPVEEALAVTVSQGVAAFSESRNNLEELKAAADRALYRAKEEGRNRVIQA
ncbi:MAG: GGDEF domain-containing protein [Spirochaetales bacterium]|nr:GGDEF domain-containing protein [Spirochaetales bacterium]